MASLRAVPIAAYLLFLYECCPGQALPNMEAKICTICLPEGLFERAAPVEVSCAVGLLRSKTVNVDVDTKGCFVLTKPDPSEPKSFQCSIEFSRTLVAAPRISLTRTFTYNSTDGCYTDKYVVEVCPLVAAPRFTKLPPTNAVGKAAPKLKHRIGRFFGHIPH